MGAVERRRSGGLSLNLRLRPHLLMSGPLMPQLQGGPAGGDEMEPVVDTLDTEDEDSFVLCECLDFLRNRGDADAQGHGILEPSTRSTWLPSEGGGEEV